jgi:hypothetical protein
MQTTEFAHQKEKMEATGQFSFSKTAPKQMLKNQAIHSAHG